MSFEMLFGLLLKNVVGNNDEKTGVFGSLEGYAAAIEEQGRKTLHAHVIVYVKGWNETLHNLQSNQKRKRKEAEREVTDFIDSVLSTSLGQPAGSGTLCPNCKKSSLDFASNQELRNSRHKVAIRQSNCALATCKSCGESYNGDELALRRTVPFDMWSMPCDE